MTKKHDDSIPPEIDVTEDDEVTIKDFEGYFNYDEGDSR